VLKRARRVCKNFGPMRVLRGIDLVVQPGQVMCLVGPSGSGKSTREVADLLVFMDDGVVVESGDPRQVLANPQHERTKAFLSKVL
jgi:ABC-type polar amino acid transport system ATPase subunit